jgi:hypothetical protein
VDLHEEAYLLGRGRVQLVPHRVRLLGDKPWKGDKKKMTMMIASEKSPVPESLVKKLL